jgi:hypothetical protein
VLIQTVLRGKINSSVGHLPLRRGMKLLFAGGEFGSINVDRGVVLNNSQANEPMPGQEVVG